MLALLLLSQVVVSGLAKAASVNESETAESRWVGSRALQPPPDLRMSDLRNPVGAVCLDRDAEQVPGERCRGCKCGTPAGAVAYCLLWPMTYCITLNSEVENGECSKDACVRACPKTLELLLGIGGCSEKSAEIHWCDALGRGNLLCERRPALRRCLTRSATLCSCLLTSALTGSFFCCAPEFSQ